MNNKLTRIFLEIIAVISIIFFAFTLTPKEFQNDIFYTIKVGECIVKNTDKITDLLPWNKGLDMMDHFSMNEDLPYTYPHWLYDVANYGIYHKWGFTGIYILTCFLAMIMGITIYLVNRKLNKSYVVSFLITIAALYGLRNFITARAQLLTFTLFILEYYGIERFLQTGKKRFVALLIAIPILLANLHCATWPFYFVLYLPYIAEWLVNNIVHIDVINDFKSLKLFLKRKKLEKVKSNDRKKIKKNNINVQKEVSNNNTIDTKRIDYSYNVYEKNNENSTISKELEILNEKRQEISRKKIEHKNCVDKLLNNAYKIKLVARKRVKYLIIIGLICIFTGLLTPIKDTPYTYLIKTNEGNTIQNINEHLPLTLSDNKDMITILVVVVGILMLTRSKIKFSDFCMLAGLIILSFMSQRQVSMLIIIGNFILANQLCELYNRALKKLNINKLSDEFYITKVLCSMIVILVTVIISFKDLNVHQTEDYVSSETYPIAASEFILNDILPNIGYENLRMYNEYNYGSYLLFKDIPVFIDSRADLYTPEFNGKKNEDGEYVGRDIFTDFLNISSLASNYESKFEEYEINYVMTYKNSKLNSLLKKDSNYKMVYRDVSDGENSNSGFVIYERLSYSHG